MARASSYLRRTIAVSALHGLLAALVSWSFGLPGLISIAAWVAVASTIPILGGLLAWLPIVALTTVHDVPLAVAIVVAVACIGGDRSLAHFWSIAHCASDRSATSNRAG